MWCKEILEVLQAKEVELTAENQIGEYILVGVATVGLQAYVDEIKVSTLIKRLHYYAWVSLYEYSQHVHLTSCCFASFTST